MSKIYKGLEIHNEEIRLATLVPGIGEEDIQVILSSVSLFADLNYEALSYVWGDAQNNVCITVNGNRVRIMKNLEAFLRRIRLPKYPRIIWVDALCINQEDVKERNIQVTLMSKIYIKASKVLIALGEVEWDVRGVFDFIRSLGRGGHVDGGCRSDQKPEEYSSCSGGWSNIRDLLQQPWWSRTWVIQEITLARHADFLWGCARLSWGAFEKAAEQLQSHIENCSSCSANLCPDCSEGFRIYLSRTSSLLHCRNAFHTDCGMDLLDLLGRYRSSGATDPRDKIYGVLGIACVPQAALIDIDYSCSTEDLYLTLVISDIGLTGTLRILNFAADNTTSSLQLPSWVPDWTSEPRDEALSVLPYRRYDLYNASNSFMLENKPTVIAQKVLRIPGIRIDTIRQISPILDPLTKANPFGTIQQCQNFVFNGRGVNSKYIAGGSLKEAFWRTSTMDTYRKTQNRVYLNFSRAGLDVGREIWEILDAIDRQDADLELIASKHANMFILLNVSLPGQRFFLTNDGYLGLGHEKIKAGDEVFILRGGRCPVVLHRDQNVTTNPEENGAESRTFSFAGKCFVHGIMDGEAARNFEESATVVNIV